MVVSPDRSTPARRSVGRVRRRQCDVRRPGARRHQLDRRRAAELCGSHDLKALKVAQVKPTEPVGIFGIGGLGHLAVPYARIMGGTVVAIDIAQSKLDLAAEHLVDAGTVDPAVALQALGGLDVAVVLAASPPVFEQAFASLRRGDRLVGVALPAGGGAMTMPIFETVLKGISIIGSIVGTRQDLAEVFALQAAGKTRVIAETRNLEDVNDAMAEVLSGKSPARLVFDYVTVPATV
jgi:propanol-preferring alcohol dehydrogenase